MKKWFLTPEGAALDIKACLYGGALAKNYPLPYLKMCAEERVWEGKPSVTQLINGTRLEYLKLTTQYATDPSDMAFAVLGTRSHKKLEDFDTHLTFPEEKMCLEDITGTMDLLEQQLNGDWWLEDYKTWGSYRVGRALGIVKKERFILDDKGLPVLLKTGKNKGQPKTEKYYVQDPAQVDLKDAIWQLNRYRMMAEEALQESIKALKIFIFVRDGGTYIAKSRGIDQNTYYIDVPFCDDGIVKGYFDAKKTMLLDALEKEQMPVMCTEHECWDGKRCLGYCNVNKACRAVGDNPHLKDGA